MALSTTLKAVELHKKGCMAVFDVSGEFPLPTLAGLHAASAAHDATGIRAVARPVERGVRPHRVHCCEQWSFEKHDDALPRLG